jgi:hypothetical protein
LIYVRTARLQDRKTIGTIKSDTLTWKTVSDLKAYFGEVVLTYKVNGIPMNYLVDPAGKILDIDLRGESLGDKLRIIYKH